MAAFRHNHKPRVWDGGHQRFGTRRRRQHILVADQHQGRNGDGGKMRAAVGSCDDGFLLPRHRLDTNLQPHADIERDELFVILMGGVQQDRRKDFLQHIPKISLPRPGDQRPALRRAFATARPAATMFSAGLADPRMKIEIEVTARRRAASQQETST